MRLLVTGASGLLGHKIVGKAIFEGDEVYATYNSHPINFGTPLALDITRFDDVQNTLEKISPDIVIHAAAYTDVDGCEKKRDFAWKINAEAVRFIAKMSSKIRAHLIYVSSDYVFNGEQEIYSEEDETDPINYYGFTKLKGEQFVKKYAKDWCIARTSAIYGWGRERKPNFATFIIKMLENNKTIKAVKDQYVSPTLNTNLAEMLIEIANKRIEGTIHTAGSAKVNRYQFAVSLAEEFKLDSDLIESCSRLDLHWKAERPRCSSLNVQRASKLLDSRPLKLDTALTSMREDRVNYETCAKRDP